MCSQRSVDVEEELHLPAVVSRGTTRSSRSPTGRLRPACLRSLEEGGFRARPGTRDELLELRHEADLAAMVGAHHAHEILPSGTKAGSLVATPGLLRPLSEELGRPRAALQSVGVVQ